jgi:hypothetical protein
MIEQNSPNLNPAIKTKQVEKQHSSTSVNKQHRHISEDWKMTRIYTITPTTSAEDSFGNDQF